MKATIAVFCIVGVVCAFGAPSQISMSNIDKILDKIPENERVPFLKYHLKLGYELNEKQNLWPGAIPSDFSTELFKYAQESHAIKDSAKLNMLSNIVCFEDGTCIDLGDIGVHP